MTVSGLGRGGAAGEVSRIRRQLVGVAQHAVLGTAFVEGMFAASPWAAAALRQFGLRFEDGAGEVAALLRGVKVAGKPVKVTDDRIGDDDLHDITLTISRKVRGDLVGTASLRYGRRLA